MEAMTAYKGNAPYIFISYAHRDRDRVFPILRRLQERGFCVWFDEGIDPGTEWDENIAQHINGCSYFIAMLTENYLASKNCKDELSYARSIDCDRFLVYLERVELPDGMRMRLGRLQALHWYKYSSETAPFEKLCAAPGIECCREGNETEEEGPTAPAPAEVASPASEQSKKKPLRWLPWAAAAAVVVIAGAILLPRLKTAPPAPAAEVAPTEETTPEPTPAPTPTAEPVWRFTIDAGEMPAGAYAENLALLEERAELLADGADYTLETEGTLTDLALPRTIFSGGADPEEFIRNYLTAPGKLYVYTLAGSYLIYPGQASATESAVVEREEIESIAAQTGAIPDTAVDGWGNTADGKETPHLVLRLTEAGAERLAGVLDLDGAGMMLDYDSSRFQNFDTYRGEDGLTFYLVPTHENSETTVRFLAGLLQKEPLTDRFDSLMMIEPDWQSAADTALPGANQTDADEIENAVILLYSTYNDDLTPGELVDVERVLKARLDALGTPYAYGSWMGGPAVRLSPECMTRPLAVFLTDTYGYVSLRCGMRAVSLDPSLTVMEEDAPVLLLRAGYDWDETVELVRQEALESGLPIQLLLDGYPILIGRPAEDGEEGALLFDTLYTEDEAPVTEDVRWLLDTLAEICGGEICPGSYDLDTDHSRFDDPDMSFGLVFRKDSVAAAARIEEAVPEAEVLSNADGNVYCSLHLPVDERLAETGTTLARRIYEASGMAECDLDQLTVYLTDEETDQPIRTRIFFEKDYGSFGEDGADGVVYARGIFAGDPVERYIDSFRTIVETDEFYAPLTEAYSRAGLWGDAWHYEW